MHTIRGIEFSLFSVICRLNHMMRQRREEKNSYRLIFHLLQSGFYLLWKWNYLHTAVFPVQFCIELERNAYMNMFVCLIFFLFTSFNGDGFACTMYILGAFDL